MQRAEFYAPSRHRSPTWSDSEGESNTVASTGSASSSASSSNTTLHPTSSRPQRPNLSHSHTGSGSFVRLKRKNTSPVHPIPTPTVSSSNDGNGYIHSHYTTSSAATHNAASLSLSRSHSHSPTPQGERSIEQVTSKVCFICYGDDSEEEQKPKKWIHPCKCSLIAHEDCLLHWISVSKPTASQRVPVACPQCNTPYTIDQRNFPILDVVEWIEATWSKHVTKILMFGVGTGVWASMSWYGVLAIRLLAGEQVAEQLLRRPWTRQLTAPLILPILVLSRTPLLDSVLPFLPLTLVLNSSLPASYPYYAIEPYPLTDLRMSWPPNPALTLCMAPWVRAVYISLRRRLFRAVLGKKRSPLSSPSSPPHAPGGNGNHNGLESNNATNNQQGVNLPGEADFARNQNRRRRENNDGDFAALMDNVDGEGQRTVVVTVSAASRIITGAFLFPGLAAAAGSVLLWLAKRQNNGRGWLARLLGLGLASSAAVGGAASSGSGLWGLSTLLPPRPNIDPVWWRNALGGALLIVIKDSWTMCRQIMETQRANSRRIQNQTFRNGLEI